MEEGKALFSKLLVAIYSYFLVDKLKLSDKKDTDIKE